MKRKIVFNLDAYERRLEAEIERGEWKPVAGPEGERLKKEIIAAAKSSRKVARVNLRLNPGDVMLLRARAEREGMPYQTLIASVLHKYATDQLVEESAIRKVFAKAGKRGERKRVSA